VYATCISCQHPSHRSPVTYNYTVLLHELALWW
jgi:hypothetical protein